MKTIQINNLLKADPNGQLSIDDIKKYKQFPKELYDFALKDDPLFHFFFEGPVIIFRVQSAEVLQKVKNYLQNHKIEFEEYNYPNTPEGKFGEAKEGIVNRNLDIFIKLNHFYAVAALTIPDNDYFNYLERLIHSPFNMKGMTHPQEGMKLIKLGNLKLNIK